MMPSRKQVVRFFIQVAFLLLTVVLASPLNAQSDFTPEELKRLQKQIDELKEAQTGLQKDLQEIKTFLRGPAPSAKLPPENLTVSLGNRPVKGDKDARLTLIEFSDYQCPFCARHFHETLPQIEKDYITTGKLKYVVRDFPLESIHKEAFKAHETVNCAGGQGKYWEMHGRLFQNQNQLGAVDLAKHAQAIGLSLPEFKECLEGGKQAVEIRKDIEEGRKLGVQGTPTFFLGVQESDGKNIKVFRMIYGAQPYFQFKEAIEWALGQGKR